MRFNDCCRAEARPTEAVVCRSDFSPTAQDKFEQRIQVSFLY